MESPIRFYESEDVERIVGDQPDGLRKAIVALLYGSGIEISVALDLTPTDFNQDTREVRGAGTKAHTRDRVLRVANWAWPYLRPVLRSTLPQGKLFPWTRWTVSDWHRATVKGLGLPVYPLHNARDHWAVTMLRAGTPVQVVQSQLGHESPVLTLRKYGRFIPSGVDRDHWEAEREKAESRRRNAGA